MHVLSLPPAFVLSQDQTLKLNKTLIGFWSRMNRREHFTPRCPKASIVTFSRNVIRQSLVWNRSPFRTFEFREHSAAHVSLSSIFSFQRTDIANAISWACLRLASDPVECRSRGSLDLDQLSRNSEANFFVASSVAAVVDEAYIGGGPSECQQRFLGILLFFAPAEEPAVLRGAKGVNRRAAGLLTAAMAALLLSFI